MRCRPNALSILAFLLSAMPCGVAAGQNDAPVDTPALSKATDVVIARVRSRTVHRDESDPNWDRRTFTYTLEVEAVEKGGFQRNQEIEAAASRTAWLGAVDSVPEFDPGCDPLPLEGERARFFLVKNDDGRITVAAPGGVELAESADPTDPVRIGDPPREEPEPAEAEPAEEKSKDPFGWDIILVLLGLPFLIGAIKQKESSRWVLLAVACLLFLSAAIIAIA
ncbi:MAG: hypothetical protein MK085_00740 [Phycisphaerales bacterium]|nr:hypothetical protein [Phycisphaerales bacterium]